jgi:hypothetical protein
VKKTRILIVEDERIVAEAMGRKVRDVLGGNDSALSNGQ